MSISTTGTSMPSPSPRGARAASPAPPDTGRRAVYLRDAIHQEADRLIAEFPQIPAGSVLRSFARALRLARLYASPTEDAVALAANAARDTLRQRLNDGPDRLPAEDATSVWPRPRSRSRETKRE